MRTIYPVPTGDAVLDANVVQTLGQVPCVTVAVAMTGSDIVLVVAGQPGFDYDGLASSLEPALDGDFDVVAVHAPGGDGTIASVLDDLVTLGIYLLDLAALTAALCADEIGWFGSGGAKLPERATERHCR